METVFFQPGGKRWWTLDRQNCSLLRSVLGKKRMCQKIRQGRPQARFFLKQGLQERNRIYWLRQQACNRCNIMWFTFGKIRWVLWLVVQYFQLRFVFSVFVEGQFAAQQSVQNHA
jgi:hypothetical protein